MQGAPFATPEQIEFLLQKILWLLSSIAQRSTCGKPPTQLAETAAVVFDCLRAVDTSDASSGSTTTSSFTCPLR